MGPVTTALGVRVRYSQWVPGGAAWHLPGEECMLVRSETDLLYMLVGVQWHETAGGCPTWTDAAGCCCDVMERAP